MKKIALVVLGCASCYFATAQSPSPLEMAGVRLTLDDCYNLASKNNIALQAARKGVERTRALEGTAWDLDKTELALGQDPTSGGSPDNALTLSQSIEFPTLYAARHGQLKAETVVESSKLNVQSSKIKGNITSLYYSLVYQAARMRILQRQDSILAHYHGIASKRYSAGESRQLEALNAKRMREENQMEIDLAKSDFHNTQLELARLIGGNVLIEPSTQCLTPLVDTCVASPFPIGEGWGGASYNYYTTPEGRLAQDRLVVADKAIKVAKNGYAPSLSLALREQLVIKGWDPYNVNRRAFSGGDFMGFEFGVGIPLAFGATKAKVKAAKKEKEMLQLQIDDEKQERETTYNAALNRLLTAKARLNYYLNTGLKDAGETTRLGSLEYENGEIDYIEYINALQQSVDTQMRQAAAINDYNQAVIKLKTLQGKF